MASTLKTPQQAFAELERAADGFTAHDVFDSSPCRGYTYDDVIFLPGFIDFPTTDIDLSSQLTRNIRLRSPVRRQGRQEL